jgi:spoIIIJ-associated protein
MSDSVFEGKDLAEALAEASVKLGIPEADLDYEIVEQGRRGLFGLGHRSVQIRVMPPIDQETKVAGHGELAGVPQRGEGRRRGGRRGRGRSDGGDGDVATEASERRPARRRRARPSRDDDEDRAPAVEKEPAPPPPEEAVDQIQTTVRQMVEMLGLDLEVTAEGTAGGTEVKLDGPDRELLIDGDAEATGAWQFLLNRMSRRAFPEGGRIQVYCNGHHQSRDEDLLALARDTAAQVLQDGRPQRLQPMNSYERRLIHLTVRKMRGVDSRSEGSGPLKRVRVFKRTGGAGSGNGNGGGRGRGRGRGRRRRGPRKTDAG